MNTHTLRGWLGKRFLPLSWLDYAAVAAAGVGLCDEVVQFLSG